MLKTLLSVMFGVSLLVASQADLPLGDYVLIRAEKRREAARLDFDAVGNDAAGLRRRLSDALGWPVARPPVRTIPLHTIRQADLVYEAIALEAEPGSWVPALVVKTVDGPRRRPAVVQLHHYGVDFMLGKSKDLDVAALLARRGFIVLSADSLLFGDRRDSIVPPPPGREFVEALTLAALDRPVFGKWIWDHVRSIDYLAGRSDVDMGRLGVVGFSKGGWEALWVAAMDQRVRATFSLMGANNHLALARSRGSYPPNALPDIVALETLLPALWRPRAVRIELGARDPAVPAKAALDLYGPAEGVPGFEIAVVDTGHEWSRLDEKADWFVDHLDVSRRPIGVPPPPTKKAPSWLPLAKSWRDDRMVWEGKGGSGDGYVFWLRLCDPSRPERYELRVDGRQVKEVTPLLHELGYLQRAGAPGVWQRVGQFPLPVGPFFIEMDGVPADRQPCFDLRVAEDSQAAPEGLLQILMTPLASPEVQAGFRPGAFVDSLLSAPRPPSDVRSWLRETLSPFREAGTAATSELPDVDRSAEPVAIIVAGADDGRALRGHAEREGWLTVQVVPRRLGIDAAERSWAAQTALQAGESLVAGTAWDVLQQASALGRHGRMIWLLADDAGAVGALVAAAASEQIAGVLVTPGSLVSIRDRISDGRISWSDIVPGLFSHGDVPALIGAIGPRPVRELRPPDLTSPVN
jgi:dienelactone hydrolase